MMIPLQERARGRWKSILPAIGINPKFLVRKNGPCPMCGGKDRWRFTDIEGKGTWFCNNCRGGAGVDLAIKFTGQSFREVAERIERVIGEAPAEPAPSEPSAASKRAALNRLWQSGRSVRPGDAVDLWITGRGIHIDGFPRALRTASNARYSGPPVSWHHAMLAMVSNPSGKPATIHKTYLTSDGKKAAVDKVRMFCAGNVPAGGAVRLTPPAEVLGIAEGIETAFAAAVMFGIPTWAALNAGGLEKFEPPTETKRLLIFGDNDVNGVGQRAAYALASRMSGRIDVEPRIPVQADTDWNDVLLA
jgi:putative DNA primase/helicase